MARARERLLALQHPEGWWRGELQTNVTMDAEDLLLREFLGVRDAGDARGREMDPLAAARGRVVGQLPRRPRRPVHHGGGLRRAAPGGRPARRRAHARARRPSCVEHGGLERARVFTRIWLALFGLWPWDELPALPPELILLPPSVPLNIYDFACWARQTIVALTVVMAQPARPGAAASASTSCGPERARAPAGRARHRGRAARLLDRPRAARLRAPAGRAAARAARWRGPSAGSSPARRPTARGAASSRRGSTR